MEPSHFFFPVWSDGFPSLWKERIIGLDPQDSERALWQSGTAHLWSQVALGSNPILSSCGLCICLHV